MYKVLLFKFWRHLCKGSIKRRFPTFGGVCQKRLKSRCLGCHATENIGCILNAPEDKNRHFYD